MRRQIILPLILIVLGVCLLEGCLFIPTFDTLKKGEHDAAKQVGGANSRKPLRVGMATRGQIEKLLGPPNFYAPDGSRTAYTWRVTEGIWIAPLCFYANPRNRERMLLLQFDHEGVLQRFRIDKDAQTYQPPSGMRTNIRATTRPRAELKR